MNEKLRDFIITLKQNRGIDEKSKRDLKNIRPNRRERVGEITTRLKNIIKPELLNLINFSGLQENIEVLLSVEARAIGVRTALINAGFSPDSPEIALLDLILHGE